MNWDAYVLRGAAVLAAAFASCAAGSLALIDGAVGETGLVYTVLYFLSLVLTTLVCCLGAIVGGLRWTNLGRGDRRLAHVLGISGLAALVLYSVGPIFRHM